MSDLYLIAHKVRGEPAFDVAINIGDETSGDLWIIPTSGHRAYPTDYILLSRLQTFQGECPLNHMLLPTEETRDHYAVNDRKSAPSVAKITDLDDLLSDL